MIDSDRWFRIALLVIAIVGLGTLVYFQGTDDKQVPKQADVTQEEH